MSQIHKKLFNDACDSMFNDTKLSIVLNSVNKFEQKQYEKEKKINSSKRAHLNRTTFNVCERLRNIVTGEYRELMSSLKTILGSQNRKTLMTSDINRLLECDNSDLDIVNRTLHTSGGDDISSKEHCISESATRKSIKAFSLRVSKSALNHIRRLLYRYICMLSTNAAKRVSRRHGSELRDYHIEKLVVGNYCRNLPVKKEIMSYVKGKKRKSTAKSANRGSKTGQVQWSTAPNLGPPNSKRRSSNSGSNERAHPKRKRTPSQRAIDSKNSK